MFIKKLLLRKNLVFIYSDRYAHSGSTVMRGQQLSELAQNFLPDYRVKYEPLSTKLKNSILFLTKGAIYSASTENLKKLSKTNKLIFDPVDSVISAEKVIYADAIVAACRMSFEEYKKIYKTNKVFVLDHHVDPRIRDDINNPTAKSCRAGYFGEVVNTVSTPDIEKLVDFIQVDTFRQDNAWFNKLKNYNLHYAIRRKPDKGVHKPFLKGFTAAKCRSNIIIQASEKEALYWLGNDYPFLLHKEPTEKNILELVNYALKSYGTKEWESGLETMRKIRKETSNEAITKQLEAIIRQA